MTGFIRWVGGIGLFSWVFLIPSSTLAEVPTYQIGAIPYLMERRDTLVAEPGSIPIILTAGHGGTDCFELAERKDPGEDNRPDGCLGGDWVKGTDGKTNTLTDFLADAIENEFGGRPYKVVSLVDRVCVDFNRDPLSSEGSVCSFDDPGGWAYWDGYHNTIEEYVAQVDQLYGNCGLLMDIHGFGSERIGAEYTLVIGTGSNSKHTLPNMRSRNSSLPFLFAEEDGFVQRLLARGSNLHLEVRPTFRNDPDYTFLKGSYTIRRYSRRYGHRGGPQSDPSLPMIDSLQLEFGPALRYKEVIDGRIVGLPFGDNEAEMDPIMFDPNSDTRGADEMELVYDEAHLRATAAVVAQALHDAWQGHLSGCHRRKKTNTRIMYENEMSPPFEAVNEKATKKEARFRPRSGVKVRPREVSQTERKPKGETVRKSGFQRIGESIVKGWKRLRK